MGFKVYVYINLQKHFYKMVSSRMSWKIHNSDDGYYLKLLARQITKKCTALDCFLTQILSLILHFMEFLLSVVILFQSIKYYFN